LCQILSVVFDLLSFSGIGCTLISTPDAACAQHLIAHSGETLALLFQKGWIYDGFLLVHWVAFVAQLAQYLTCRTVELTQLVNTVTLQLSASCVLVRRVSEAAGR
jgi:hypothetical protein